MSNQLNSLAEKMLSSTDNLIEFLKSTEKYLARFLKTDVVALASGSAWLIAGKIANLIITIAVSIIYARFLSKETYGGYRYILGIFGMLGIFALPGMSTSIVRSIARGHEGTFRATSRLIFISCFAITIIGTGVAFYFGLTGRKGLGIGILVIAVLTPFIEGLGNWRGYYEGKQLFRTKTGWTTLGNIFHGFVMAVAVLIIYLADFSTSSALALLALVHGVATALPNILMHRKVTQAIPRDATIEGGSLWYGLHLSFAGVPSTIAYSIDSFLLYSFLGPVSVAIYSFAIAPIEQLKALINSVADVAFPRLSITMATTAGKRAIQQTLVQKIIRASLITLLIVGTYIALSPLLFSILFPQYREAVLPSQIFSLSLILIPISILDKTLKAEGDLTKVYVYNIVSPILLITALVILIPLYGIWGAIAGRIVGRIANFLFLYILFKI